MQEVSASNEYNFLKVDPRAIMSPDEVEHFEAAMSPHNTDTDASLVDLAPYIQDVVEDFDRLFFGKETPSA